MVCRVAILAGRSVVSGWRIVYARGMAVNGKTPQENLESRFQASMVLAGVGDAMGFRNGKWEFCKYGQRIHEDLHEMGGLNNITLNTQNWSLSDDTVMHIATAEALLSPWKEEDREKLYSKLAEKYVECMGDMVGRSPGLTCGHSAHILKPEIPQGYFIPFNPYGGGCGASMRSAPIGLLYWKPGDIQSLVEISIESGRMTHNHPTGYLGSLASALFVSYSIQRKPMREWGRGLLDTLKMAWKYIEESGRDMEDNKKVWSYFEGKWTDYLTLRGILDGQTEPNFPENYGVIERDKFYSSISHSGKGGASGHDAPMIAYDALLGCKGSWSELCFRAMLHGGDSDSTGITAGACWGAWHGYVGVPECHYKELEYVDRLKTLGKKLYEKSMEG